MCATDAQGNNKNKWCIDTQSIPSVQLDPSDTQMEEVD